MANRNQVPLNVRVTPEKKEEWKTSISNDETLAGVVRRAVDRELNDEYVHVDAADHLDGGDDIDFSEVTTDLDSLSGQVEALQRELDDALTPGSMPPEDQIGDSFAGVLITYVHQRERLGLGHAVLQAEPHIDGSFLLVNGDNVLAGSVEPAIAAADTERVDGVLAVEEVSRTEASTTGVLELDGDRVTDLVEKPDDPPSTVVTTGCVTCSPRTCSTRVRWSNCLPRASTS
jgi:NDP-sugar pyrophosphorylase family protein